MTRIKAFRTSFLQIASRALLVVMTVGCARGTVNEPVAPQGVALVALGASDVVGVGAARPEYEGWAPVLASFMPEGTRFLKVGVSGWQAHQVLDLGLPDVLQAQPDTVVLWIGVNDFLAEKPLSRFQRELEDILVELARSEARLVVINLPDLDRLPAFRSERARIRQQLPAWQRAVAELGRRHGARVIDLAALSAEIDAHPEYLSADGFHPSSIGYRRLAEIIFVTLGTPQEPRRLTR
jgi:lysophospholipase L1-like esterase